MERNRTFTSERILHQSGQAVVEYILLLIVIVSLVIGAAKAFGNLNSFMNAYIGDYIVCLMEYGELPSLGVSDSKQKNHSGGSSGKSCDQQFAGFTFESGRPPTGGSSSTMGGQGSRSGNRGGENRSNSTNSGSNKNSSKNAENSSSKKNNADGGSGNRGNVATKNSSPYATGQINRSNANYGTSDGDLSPGNKKIKIIEEQEELGKKKSDAYGETSRSRRRGNGQEKYRAITGQMAAEIEKKLAKKSGPTRSVRTLAGDTGNRFGPYKKTFTPPETKTREIKNDDNSGFSFGYIIRWLIIGGMLLALIIFFGGQIMNYSNSKD